MPTTTDNKRNLLTLDELISHLKTHYNTTISKSTLYKYTHRKLFPTYGIGRQLLLDADEVAQILFAPRKEVKQ